jgi:hypothetical protein
LSGRPLDRTLVRGANGSPDQQPCKKASILFRQREGSRANQSEKHSFYAKPTHGGDANFGLFVLELKELDEEGRYDCLYRFTSEPSLESFV